MTVRRPFANGLELLLNYTWAKATDTGQVGGANGTFYGGDVPSDPNNIRFDNGPSDIDIRNRMTLSFVYQPKIMEDNKRVENILDGFEFSGDGDCIRRRADLPGRFRHDLLGQRPTFDRATRTRAASSAAR